MSKPEYTSIDEYIKTCELHVQKTLQELQEFIAKSAPQATTKISWSMPTFYLNGNLIHFFVHKKHIGLYPGDKAISAFSQEFEQAGYKYSKGAVQLPLDKPLPYDLIAKIVEFGIKENTQNK